MKALVLGLGISGKSACNFLKKRGYEVIGIDDAHNVYCPKTLKEFTVFVPSPGISRMHPIYQLACKEKIPIKGEAELGLSVCNNFCIGITGTNGKTTVVKMIEHVLNTCGKKARAVGNIGEPLTQEFEEEVLVVELSSYQLETLHTKVFSIAVILNITEDHLDRYKNFEEYAHAKAHLQNCMKKNAKLFVHKQVDPMLFSQPYTSIDGSNEEMVFHIVKQLGISRQSFFQALASFSKLPHRLEYVATINNVQFYNDSKATNVAAVINAIRSMDSKVVLLVGGKDKGLSFEPLSLLREKLVHVIAFGEAREKITDALKNQLHVHQVETAREAIAEAKKIACENETVLFSPGCASFDEFSNYEERGEFFKRLIQEK